MLVIPYSTALRFNKRPYVSYAIVLLCVIIFYFQITNLSTINRLLVEYCDSIHVSTMESSSLDILAGSRYQCMETLSYLHEQADHDSLEKFERAVKEDYQNDYSLDDKAVVVRQVRAHLDRFQETAPTSVTGNLMHYPDELNPVPMITSSLAHGGWGHIVFNLIFFLAFAPAIEILINNRLRFIGILAGICIITGLAYALSVAVSGAQPLPTLGLSGIVMAMIGMSAYLMPHARIRVFVWFIFLVRNFYIPVWALAAWYIGLDTLDLIFSADYGGVNLVAHVSGGVAGYLIGFFGLKDRREDVADELQDEIESMRAERAIGGATFSSSAGRREMLNRQRERQAHKDYEHHVSELYRYVKSERDSEAIVLMLEDYDIQCASTEVYEELYERVRAWGDSRFLLCLGRLLINLFMQQRKFARALVYVEQCRNMTEHFMLADSAHVLLLANMARDNHQYQLAYLLVRDAHARYGSAIDIVRCQLMEIELLWQNLDNVQQARETVKRYLCMDGLPSRTHLLEIARLLQQPG